MCKFLILRVHFDHVYYNGPKSQAGVVLSNVLNFFGNLSQGVLMKYVLTEKKCTPWRGKKGQNHKPSPHKPPSKSDTLFFYKHRLFSAVPQLAFEKACFQPQMCISACLIFLNKKCKDR